MKQNGHLAVVLTGAICTIALSVLGQDMLHGKEPTDKQIALWRQRYVTAKPGYERMLVCLEAIEKEVIAPGQHFEIVRRICGDDCGATNKWDEQESGFVVHFDVQPVGRPDMSAGYFGWYMAVEYWTATGQIEYYEFSNVHKPVRPDRQSNRY